MTVEEAVCDHLLADPGVSALVGSRVYLMRFPQRPTLPAIRVQLISEPKDYHLRGPNNTTTSRVQVDSVSEEASGFDPYAEAASVADAADNALSGVQFITGGVEVTGSFRDTRMAMYEPDELRMVRILQDYMVWTR